MSTTEEAVVTSAQPIEVQKDAERLGWIPPSRFKGDPTRFVDADIYIKRGEEVLPIVKEQNKRLHTELDSLKRESQATAHALKAAILLRLRRQSTMPVVKSRRSWLQLLKPGTMKGLRN